MEKALGELAVLNARIAKLKDEEKVKNDQLAADLRLKIDGLIKEYERIPDRQCEYVLLSKTLLYRLRKGRCVACGCCNCHCSHDKRRLNL